MPFRVLIALLAALAAFNVLAQTTVAEPDDEDEDAPASAAAVEPQAAEKLPLQDLTEPMLYQLLLGEIAAQRGDPALAAKTYLELAKRTHDPRIARRAVEIANYARAPKLALEAARVWHAADPQSAQALRMLTVLLVSARRVDEAEPYIAKLLAGEGNGAAGGLMQLGQLLAQNPDKAVNLRVVQRVAQSYPQLPEAHFAVAQAAVAANDEALALGELGRAAELRPDWEHAVLYEAQLLRRKSPEEAVRRLAGFLERFPNARDARLGFARLLVGEKRYPEARAQFQALLAIHKDDREAIYGVGLLALQAKEYAIAETNLKRLLELGHRDADGVRLTLGQLAEEQKDWPRAIEWYQSIQRGEQALQARLRTANVLAKQGRLEEARTFLRSAGSGGEHQVQYLIAEAQLLREANRHREAFDLLGGALESNPDQPDLLYDHALTAEKLERVDVLEANLRKLIQARPNHAHAYNALGYSLAERNERLPEARKLIERALQISPDDHFIIDSMGWVLYRMGDLTGAADYLRRAWRNRQDGEIGAHLGEVLWVMGERAEAERVWKEAAEASPENATLQNTIKRLRK